MYTCYIYIHLPSHVCMYRSVNIYIYIQMHVCTYIYIYICICRFTYVYMYIYIRIDVRMDAYGVLFLLVCTYINKCFYLRIGFVRPGVSVHA